MADTGNGQALLTGSGGQKGAGAAKENALQLAVVQLIQQIAAECDGAASAAGSAGMDILVQIVKDKGSAVCQFSAQIQMVSFSQFQQNVFSQLAQIACDDQIIIQRGPVQIIQMGSYGFKGSGGHGGTHVVGIFDPKIHNRTGSAAFDPGPRTG